MTVRVIRAKDTRSTDQTAGLEREAGVDQAVGATAIFMGVAVAAPHSRSAPHHHGAAETAAYVISGHVTSYFGDDFSEVVHAGPGDYFYVGPFVPHIEANETNEPAVSVVARTPSNIVVNLDTDA